jgi:beta-glucanase (GH16 family)
VPTSAALSAWHTETVEWSPGQATFILDGHVVGTVTTKIPETPHDFVIQSQTCNGCGGSVDAGDVQVDWVAIYSRA